MQACVEQKHSDSSFVGAYSSNVAAHVDLIRFINTQILHWRGFDTHVPACFSGKCTFGLNFLIQFL
jgi:hypothetical protein